MPRSKRYLRKKSLIDSKKSYSLEEAVELAKKTSPARFNASIEMHVRLGIDPQKSEQQVRGMLVLPYSLGSEKKIAAFVESEKEKEAKEAGADFVGGEELINEISQSGKINFDLAVATPGMMPKLAKIAKILGPKGVMPNPKDGTVTNELTKTIADLKKGKIIFKNDKGGNVHVVIGKVNQETQEILANARAFLDALKKSKPSSSRGVFLKNVVLTTTMGPAIKVNVI